MFGHLEDFQLQLLYRGLKCWISHGDGTGFHNRQRNHAVYISGAEGADPRKIPLSGDSPEENQVFKLLYELSKELKTRGIRDETWFYDFTDWKRFCQYAVDLGLLRTTDV